MPADQTKHLLYAAGALLMLLMLLLAQILFWNARMSLPALPQRVAAPTAIQSLTLAPELWRVLKSQEGKKANTPVQGALNNRFRLAGVFIVMTDRVVSGQLRRCAILDDLSLNSQMLAEEGEKVNGALVKMVALDYVLLVGDDGEEATLLLAPSTLSVVAADEKGASDAPMPPEVLETNRFGNRIGETRWEFSRTAVEEYYQEMMDSPERLSALFLSMEPDWNENGRIAGYRLNIVGERDFYTQVGLQQGDIVRKVNSMNMTSRRRAEHFIGEVAKNNLNTIVLDVERNGEAKKFIYMLH